MSTRNNIGRAATGSIVVANGTALSANMGRVGGVIQNLGVTKLYVKLGAGASASSFTCILAPGAVADDGYGGSFPLDGWVGDVSVYEAAGAPRCAVTETVG